MNVIRSFTLKSLKRNKKRTAVTIIGVIISTAMLTAVSVFFSSFVDLIRRDTIASEGNWHAEITDVPAGRLEAVTDDPGIQCAVLSRDLGYAALTGSVNESKPYLFVRQYSENGFSQMSVTLLEGRLPQNGNEVVISETIDNSAGVSYQIGDTLDLTLCSRTTAEGEEIRGNQSVNYIYDDNGTKCSLNDMLTPQSKARFTIVGVIARPSFEKSWSAGCGVLGYLDKSALSPSDTVNVLLTMKTVSTRIYDTVAGIAHNAGLSESAVAFNDELLRYYGVVSYDNVLTFIYVFAGIIIAIIIIASVSLIYNSFAISVSERSRQLGLLSSVGATKRQKRASMYVEGAFIGLLGIPLGILAGIGGMAVTLKAIQPLLDGFFNVASGLTLDLVVPFWSVWVTAALAALTIFISVYVPARRASKISPIDAIRLSQDIRLTRRTVKTSRLTRALFGFEATVALKNLKRNRKKYRSTIVSLIISIVLFLTVSMYASMTQMVYSATAEGTNYDIVVSFSQIPDLQRRAAARDLASLDLVTGHTEQTVNYGYIDVPASLLGDSAKKLYGDTEQTGFGVVLTALDKESFSDYCASVGVSDADYSDAGSPKAILINYGQDYYPAGDGMMKISGNVLNAQAGVTLDYYIDAENKAKTAAIMIGAVTDQRPMGTLVGGFQSITLVVSEEALSAVAASLGIPAESMSHAIFLSTSDDQKLEKQINEVLQTLPLDLYNVLNIQSVNRSQQNLNTFLGVFVYGFIILISLICVANIFNTVSTNIALRRREFAMMRSVGMTPHGFNRMIRFESIFYGLKALLFGLPVSVLISFGLYRLQQGVLITGFTLPWKSYAFAVLMLLVIVFSTMLYSTHRIKKENIIDALKDENL